MRKLTPVEQNAVNSLAERGPLCPGEEPGSVPHQIIKDVLDGLVKKKRATVEMTDDGPRYHLTAQGREDAR
jgi:hypothetical protein